MKTILVYPVFFSLLAPSFAGEPEQPNAVQDGDFEILPGVIQRGGKPGQWGAAIHGNSDVVFSIVEGKGVNGSRCVQYSRSTGGSDNIHLDQIVPVLPNAIYELRAWVRTDSRLQPVLCVGDIEWRQIAAASVDAVAVWTEVRFAFRTGNDDKQVRLQWFAGADGRLRSCLFFDIGAA